MARPGVFGQPGESLRQASRQATLRHDEEAVKTLAAPRITQPGTPMRLAMAALAGMLLLMAQTGFFWAWIGASFFMLAAAGAASGIGAAAGAIAAATAYLRVTPSVDVTGIFWALMIFHAAGGAVAGALAAELSRKLPPQAFAFLAALLPAGLEHLGSFAGGGNLTSTALTQYAHPIIVKTARLGGLAAVTYVIFVFGGAVAVAVRYVREIEIMLRSALPPLAFVVVALLYGAVASSAGRQAVFASAYVPFTRIDEYDALCSREDYDEEAWTEYWNQLADDMHQASRKSAAARAIDRVDTAQNVELLVWPEASIVLNESTKEPFFKRLGSMANSTGCVQAAAYYDFDKMQSAAVVVADREAAAQPHARRFFVPEVDDVFVERQIAAPGDAPPSPVPTGIGKVGTILSLDANFFEDFKSIAKDGGRIACVCGLIDERVPRTSLRLLVYNAAMSGLAVMRSARKGTMAAISPDGKIIASKHTPESADGELQARLPLGEADTLFLSIGNAFAWLALLAGLASGLYAAALREPPQAGARRTQEAGSGPISYKTREGLKRL